MAQTAYLKLKYSKTWSVAVKDTRRISLREFAYVEIPTIRTAKTNRILAALPRDAFERVLPDLVLKAMPVRGPAGAR